MRRLLLLVLSVCILGSKPTNDIDADDVEGAIIHILKNGLKGHKIFPHLRNRMLKDHDARRELSVAIDKWADEYDLPEMLLVTIAYREGGFLNSAVGKMGEKATFQIMPRIAKSRGCDMSDYDGAAKCSAGLLSELVEKCGNISGAVMFYATGRTCKADSDHLKWILRDRLGIMKKLEKIVHERG